MSHNRNAEAWFKGLQLDSDVALRLFCFSYAGGGASTYLRWRPHFPKYVDICAVQPPGREDRISETPINDIPTLVKAIADAITPFVRIPFAFFGHCNGALIAFELARELRRRQNVLPKHMFVSSFRSPELTNSNRVLHSLPRSEFVTHLKTYGGMPEEILGNDNIVTSLMPTLRADFQLHENYEYIEEEKLDCPITIFGGLQDKIVTRKELSGWRNKTSTSSIVKLFPGGHFFLDTHRKYLLKVINNELKNIATEKKLLVESA